MLYRLSYTPWYVFRDIYRNTSSARQHLGVNFTLVGFEPTLSLTFATAVLMPTFSGKIALRENYDIPT